MRSIRFIAILIILPVFAANGFGAGNTGLAFLKLGADAQTTAMGEVAAALSQNAAGLFWNPAGVAWMEARQVHFTHNEWIQGIDNEALSVILPCSYGVVGVSAMLTNIGGIERRTTATAEPLGEVSAQDFALGLSYARKISSFLSAGLSAKLLNEKIYIDTATGYAIDLGLRYKVGETGLYGGGALLNLGSMSALDEEKTRLPATLRLGFAWNVPFAFHSSEWLIGADYVKVFDDESHINIGGQVGLSSMLSLRLGYQTNYDNRTVTAGFGLALGPLSLDYAYIPFDADLGNSQRFTFLVDF
ncbi:hypothetical protein A2V82_16010 [candidate division KSB1 bacterium RBG_16_48_16]|nr:MAG: hypothetical protein A2V82_16010 [candidate division KSB1 bacterium RBG_16_48_16]